MRHKPFSQLFKDSWTLYCRGFAVGVPYSLLYLTLPVLLMGGALFYALQDLLSPLLARLPELTGALLNGRLDAAYLESALDAWLATLTDERLASFMLGMMGALLVCLPLSLVFALVLEPLHAGRLANLFSRGWHGVELSYGQAFAALNGRRGKLVALGLIQILAGMVAGVAVSLVTGLLSGVGTVSALLFPPAALLVGTLSYAADMAASLALGAWGALAVLVGINEDVWGFAAAGRAFSLL